MQRVSLISTCTLFAACATPHAAKPATPAALVTPDVPTTPLPHRSAGSNIAEARAFYGIPILQKSFFWDGNAETDDAGGAFHVAHFLANDAAIGLGLVPANWFVSGADVQSLELSMLIRLYPFPDWPLFFDGGGGFQEANGEIPPGGTFWNFTFNFGAGLDFPVTDSTSVMFGVQYHHISNALGRQNDRNPSQNEARVWLGFCWDF